MSNVSSESGAASVPAQSSDDGGDGVASAAFDQSHDLIVVVDDAGTIILTNAAWRAAADRRGGSAAATGCGANYLEACERSGASVVAAGIRAVLAGERSRFEFDYPCPSPVEDAWYSLAVSALAGPGSGAVLTHIMIRGIATDRMSGLERGLDPVTMLATSPAGVTGLAHMLADAQARASSLAVVTITLSGLVEIEARHGRQCRDDVVVHTVARLLRLTRPDDVLIRPSTNELVLVAPVADARGAQFLRDNIAQVMEAVHLVGAIDVESPVDVDVVASDPFSTLDSLLPRFATEPSLPPPLEVVRDVARDISTRGDGGCRVDPLHVPLVVYSLPDGYVLAANEAARYLFGFGASRSHRLHARDIVDSKDLRHTSIALSALGSGATDSYRAQRTLRTADGPLAVMTSVRRLLIDSRALAVVLTVPVEVAEVSTTATDDPFAVALVAGTIDAEGAVATLSAATSPMEADLSASLTGTLSQAVHPDERNLVDTMLESMRRRGSASGAIRLASEQGWLVCQCQLFTMTGPAGDAADTARHVATGDSFAFVASAGVSTTSMLDKIARLERHIRRIGSEVHTAGIDMTVRPSVDASMSAALDALQLTTRQRDIVERLAQGQRVASIAAALYVSRSTVRNHLSHVYQLVGVHSQEELLSALKAP